MKHISTDRERERRTYLVGLRLAAIFGCTVALSAAAPAFADDLTGDWLFETSNFADDDCQISGRITFTETPLKNTYSCKFESEQICGKLNDNLYIRVQQSCTAQRTGKQIAIKTVVDKVLERRTNSDPDLPLQNYLADNFILQMQKNLQEMVGSHNDAQRQLNARFWREKR